MTPATECAPLSPAQMEIWLGQTKAPESPIYSSGEYLEVATLLDPERLKAALRHVVSEVDALRMETSATEPIQRLGKHPRIDFQSFDFREDPEGKHRALAWIRRDTLTALRFDGAPLHRFALFLLGPEKSYFYHYYHHIILDGLSVMIVADRIAEAYNALGSDGLPEPVPLGDFETYQTITSSYPGSTVEAKDRAHWEALLHDAPTALGLSPRPVPKATIPFNEGSRVLLPRDFVGRLTPPGTTLAQTLYAATALYLHLLSGENEILLGMTVSGRIGRSARELPGMFSNCVPLRLRLEPEQSFEALKEAVGREMRAALRHQRYRIEDLERTHGEIYRVSVNVITTDRPLAFEGARAHSHKVANGPLLDFCLCAFDFDHTQELLLDFQYNPDRYTHPEIEAHQRNFVALLEALSEAGNDGKPHREWKPFVSPFSGEQRRGANAPFRPEHCKVSKLTERKNALPHVALLKGHGTLELGEWERALEAVLASQPAFANPHREGGAYSLSLETSDHLPPLEECLAREASRIFSEEEAPLRLRVLRSQPGEHRMLLSWSPENAGAEAIQNLLQAFGKTDRGEAASATEKWRAMEEAAQRAWVSSSAWASEVLWRKSLAGAPPPTLLPVDYDRSNPQAHRAFCIADLPSSVAACSKAELLAALAHTLRAHTGESSVHVGVATPLLDSLTQSFAGNFSTVLPAILAMDDEASFASLVEQSEQLCQTLETYRFLSAEAIERLRSKPDEDTSETFTLQWLTLDSTCIDLGSESIDLLATSPSTPQNPLSLSVLQSPQGTQLTLAFDSGRYQRASLEWFLRHLVNGLRAGRESPHKRLRELRLDTPDERRRTLVELNTPQGAPGRPLPLTRLFEEQVARRPDAIALEDATRSISFAETNQRANQLARQLQQEGAGPEGIVGLLVERSCEAIIAILGILKAGAAYLPIDPRIPEARIEQMLSDAGARSTLVSSSLASRLSSARTNPILLDDEGRRSALSPENLPESPDLQNLAYVIFTSGSTGVPKGVMATHGNYSQMVQWVSQAFGYDQDARTLQSTSLSFDVSAEEIASTLISGGTLYCPTHLEMHPGPPLIETLAKRRITHLSIAPSALDACPVRPLPHLRRIVLGGEAVPRRLAETWSPHVNLINAYGPTETSILATADRPLRMDPGITIGRPIDHYRCYILDTHGQPVPQGCPGELFIGGIGVTRGYLNRPRLTAERFLPDPFGGILGERLYRSGDRCRLLADGRIVFLGRIDQQVKIRGYRIELGEINAALQSHPEVEAAETVVEQSGESEPRLVAFVTGPGDGHPNEAILRAHLAARLPAYMCPSRIIGLPAIPLNTSGKVDTKALLTLTRGEQPEEERRDEERLPTARSVPVHGRPLEATIETIRAIWKAVLGRDEIPVDANFFDLGGHSLSLVKVRERLARDLGTDLQIVDLFAHPTVDALARKLAGETVSGSALAPPISKPAPTTEDEDPVVIVGMAGRFPKAADLEALWSLLQEGREGISRFSPEELRAAGVSEELISNPHYVPVAGPIEHLESFDASFFGMSPRDAAMTDPQHRIFLELAWHALEHAGHSPSNGDETIGLYAGVGINTYLLENLTEHQEALFRLEGYSLSLGNEKDFVPSRVSYKLGLRGPSINVNTACSSSLVAVHLARRAILAGDCDMALAGGVSASARHRCGYLHQPNSIASPDGHCRAFSAEAHGTVGSSGAGLVLLKRLSAARRDRNTIYAVIQGTAINNDGHHKVGFTAPSVEGQTAVVRKCLEDARISAREIDYVEAHGTGTELGDPIEIKALSEVFHPAGVLPQACRIGSVKTNLGHTDAAAGVLSLLKCTLALNKESIPATLHCDNPNPAIHFPRTPFRVNAECSPWKRSSRPRYCGINSFGIGGTNAHVILREAPEAHSTEERRRHHYPVLLSAQTQEALNRQREGFAHFLRANPDIALGDLAFTTAVGRSAMPFRESFAAADLRDLRTQLEAPPGALRKASETSPPCAFLFPGQGSQFTGMTRQLYKAEPLYRETVDHCSSRLQEILQQDLRQLLFAPVESPGANAEINQTAFAQPSLFVTQYALARLWMSWGVQPAALLGHSLGELVAASLAGVFSLDDALALVAARGRLMQAMPAGAMLAVRLSASDLKPFLDRAEGVTLAAHNGPRDCVVSGASEKIEAFSRHLREKGAVGIPLITSHAFHSPMMEAASEAFREVVQAVPRHQPEIPFISNLTGTWIQDEEACDPEYWAKLLFQPVRFHEGLSALFETGPFLCLEIGSGRSLGNLARRHPECPLPPVNTLPAWNDETPDTLRMSEALGEVWKHGITPRWDAFFKEDTTRRIALPLYPFERQRHWIGPGATPPALSRPVASTPTEDPDEMEMTETEVAIATHWRALLGVEDLSPGDDFFKLGGESLLGVQLLSRMRDAHQVELELEDLFNAPTLEEFAARVEDKILEEFEKAAP